MSEDLNVTDSMPPIPEQDGIDDATISTAQANGNYPQDSTTDPEMQRRAQYVKAFDEFEPAISATLEGRDRAKLRGHEGAVGAGTNGVVLPIMIANKSYVAKVYLSDGEREQSVEDDFLIMERSVVDPHLAQLAAISYEHGITVMETMPGADFPDTSIEQVTEITDQQLADALVTMRRAHDADIDFDYSKARNFKHDKLAGFGFIDLERARSTNHDKYQSYSEKVMRFGNLLSGMGGSEFKWDEPASYSTLSQETEVRLRVLGQYRSICIAQPDQEYYGEALAALDKSMQAAHDFMRNVATPGWVDQEIMRRRESEESLRAQREELASRVVVRDGYMHVPEEIM